MLLSSTQLDEARRWYAFSYRAVLYLSMTVMFVYVTTCPAWPCRPGGSCRSWPCSGRPWQSALGFAALAAPTFRLTTPVSMLLPANVASSPYVQDRISPSLAQVQTFIGYALTRPAASFTYTNEWGGGGRATHPHGPGRHRPGPLLPDPQRHPAAAGRLPGPDRHLGQPRPVGRAGRRPGERPCG